jgi:hypothetical protein
LTEPDRGRFPAPEAAGDDSRASAVRPSRSERGIPGRIRASGRSAWLILGLALASAILLFATELATLSYRTIGIGGCESRVDPGVCTTTGADAHGHALWLIALLVLLFGWGAAVGRSRPAGLAVLVCGLVVLGIALIADAPDLGGLRGLDAQYTQVRAHTGAAFWLELVGAALAVAAGALGMRRRPDARERSARRAARSTSAA